MTHLSFQIGLRTLKYFYDSFIIPNRMRINMYFFYFDSTVKRLKYHWKEKK
jgi:hypothetical protein